MKKVKILIDREPLSKDYVKSKQNFGQVLSQVKKLKPPIWKSPWFYGPVGLAAVTLSLKVVSSIPPDNTTEPSKLEAVLPLEQRKIESETLAFISPNDVQETSFREMIPINNGPEDIVPKPYDDSSNKLEETGDAEIYLPEKIIINEYEAIPAKPLTKFPSISRIYTGEIAILELCSNKIECLDSKITSFSLQYYNGKEDVVVNVDGNSISNDVCKIISQYNLNEMVFITKIKAINSEGLSTSLPSMNLTPVNREY